MPASSSRGVSNPVLFLVPTGPARASTPHYVWIDVDYIINHDECPILSLDALEEAMPDFQWDGGHSGRELPVKESIILEKMWLDYLDTHKDYFDGLRARSKKKMCIFYPTVKS